MNFTILSSTLIATTLLVGITSFSAVANASDKPMANNSDYRDNQSLKCSNSSKFGDLSSLTTSDLTASDLTTLSAGTLKDFCCW
jgi:hypothetical protein